MLTTACFKIAVCQGLLKPRTTHWYHPKRLHKLQPCWAPQEQKQESEQTKASFFTQPHSVSTARLYQPVLENLSQQRCASDQHTSKQISHADRSRCESSFCMHWGGTEKEAEPGSSALRNEMLQTSNWKVQELNRAWQELIHERQLCAESNRPSIAVLVCSV